MRDFVCYSIWLGFSSDLRPRSGKLVQLWSNNEYQSFTSTWSISGGPALKYFYIENFKIENGEGTGPRRAAVDREHRDMCQRKPNTWRTSRTSRRSAWTHATACAVQMLCVAWEFPNLQSALAGRGGWRWSGRRRADLSHCAWLWSRACPFLQPPHTRPGPWRGMCTTYKGCRLIVLVENVELLQACTHARVRICI